MALIFDGFFQRPGGDGEVVGVPDGVSLGNHDRLRRFVADAKPIFQFAGKFPIFDHQDGAAGCPGILGNEGLELFVGCRAARTLRAMLENNDWIFVRTLDELLQILFTV